jgi:hypothetical protein
MNTSKTKRMALIGASLLTTVLAGCGEKPEKTAMLYGAWMKTHPGHEITPAEWQALREEYMLPGQTRPNTDSGDIALGVAAGTAMGMGMAAGSGGRR